MGFYTIWHCVVCRPAVCLCFTLAIVGSASHSLYFFHTIKGYGWRSCSYHPNSEDVTQTSCNERPDSEGVSRASWKEHLDSHACHRCRAMCVRIQKACHRHRPSEDVPISMFLHAGPREFVVTLARGCLGQYVEHDAGSPEVIRGPALFWKIPFIRICRRSCKLRVISIFGWSRV